MDANICWTLMKLFAAMIAMLCVANGLDTEEAGSIESGKELDLQRLMSLSDSELREQLELRLKRNDVMGVHEIMHMEAMYSRFKGASSDGYFAIRGMILTGGEWHRRYKTAFWNSKICIATGDKIIKELLHEIATGEVWIEVNRRLAIAVVKKLDENLNNGGQARARNEEPPNLVYHIASHVEALLLSKKRRWMSAMNRLLRSQLFWSEMASGKFNEELVKMIDENEDLGNFFCSSILDDSWETIKGMQYMIDSNKVLARKILVNAVENGNWLYNENLYRLMQSEKMKRFYSEDDEFKRMSMVYTASGELLVERLMRSAQEGRLNKLVKGAIKRLVKCGRSYHLRKLLRVTGREALHELQCGNELESALRQGAKNAIENRSIPILTSLLQILGRVVFDKLLDRGDFDTALKRGVKRLIMVQNISYLEMLLEIVQTRLNKLLGSEEISTSLKNGVLFVIEHGRMKSLRWLVGIQAVNRKIYDEWKDAEEIDTAVKRRVESLAANGNTYDLRELANIMELRFKKLMGNTELDAALERIVKVLVEEEQIIRLKVLVETVGSKAFCSLVDRAGLGDLLKKSLEKLIEDGKVYALKILAEAMPTKFDDLVNNGDLDNALEKGIVMLIYHARFESFSQLMEIGLVERRARSGVLSTEKLDRAFKAAKDRVLPGT